MIAHSPSDTAHRMDNSDHWDANNSQWTPSTWREGQITSAADTDSLSFRTDAELNFDSNFKPFDVVAGEDIPAGATEEGTVPFARVTLGLDLLRDGQEGKSQKSIKVFSTDGRLHTSNGESLGQSLKRLRSAKDRHEQNLELARCQTDPASLYLRTLRPVARGKALFVWYEEGLAREMGVPILTPVNIKGHQEYVCTRCKSVYSQPNVLKAHLFLECNQSERTDEILTLTPFNTYLDQIKDTHPSPVSPVNFNNGGILTECESTATSSDQHGDMVMGQYCIGPERHRQSCNTHVHLSLSSSPSVSSQSSVEEDNSFQDDEEIQTEMEPKGIIAAGTKVKETSETKAVFQMKRKISEGRTTPSAFRAPTSSTSCDVRRRLPSEDRFMTPDSSTDQSLALNLSFKSEQAVTLSDHRNGLIPASLAYPSWNVPVCQSTGVPSSSAIPLAMSYGSFPVCYPMHQSPASQALQLHYITHGKFPAIVGNLHQLSPCFEQSLNPPELTSPPFHNNRTTPPAALIPSPSQSHIPHHTIPLPPAPQSSVHPRSVGYDVIPDSPAHSVPSTKDFLPQTRASPGNPYGISLPSDKEPLDFLPQAFFANKSKRGHLCLYCGKLYSRKYGLKIHMRTHNGYKPLKCKICSRPFGDPSNLNKHVRLHAQGETPYRCEYCGKVLVRRRDLERHVRSRHPMSCNIPDEGVDHLMTSSPCSSPISVVDESIEDTPIEVL